MASCGRGPRSAATATETPAAIPLAGMASAFFGVPVNGDFEFLLLVDRPQERAFLIVGSLDLLSAAQALATAHPPPGSGRRERADMEDLTTPKGADLFRRQRHDPKRLPFTADELNLKRPPPS